MTFGSVFQFFSKDLAIDLGTANTLVYMKGKGIIINEPSVIAENSITGETLAIGKKAKEMLGKSPPYIDVIRPIKDGVISNIEATMEMLKYFIHETHNRRTLVYPRVVISTPLSITSVERRAVKESAEEAGAREVYLIEEPMAAAIGAGLAVQDPSGCMIINIGGGMTEVAVIALSGIVCSKSIRIAGDALNEAIIQFMKSKHNLLIGELTAERIKIQLGCACGGSLEKTMTVKGRDLIRGLPVTLFVSEKEIEEALSETLNNIVMTVKLTLENTPPELAADIITKGIVIAGGGALLKGIGALIQKETGLPVNPAKDPISSVVIGAGKMLDELSLLKEISVKD
ncbi:MAG: rod shape-determining protein [Candidatus Schekmanbacteria bacterium RIFCSPHIGHO2_02_FULL_38_11]|uniref:Cell shape-determining protein MreB n=1 Tax=Candidatus Schekmanbacteria bacterium RIFCSPLOWO2_12_FULL_38_15 TaxID=1817883 RepID=A0A1F7SFM1_9BACT|nr:MAG: rod shape-determining protein [Candidatus Schekmanbacteria bacterium GWA2_38_9]OGL48610.1 MAG: rod shape-determining protein [Candidatus Schekmanbacteria bacterium RIFCSPLOWO2_02_FULL_38_14]OGL50155.1 MAG: rod shape-determining protein [Candidatus Schekmanbacteria bacterium RIFCSPHIGHO2_02_FULL_38_11]OGL52590.1 MAG: rod shape-determining protein [Candidatus Schekmanbacteria bacterium RIFCSPLOWO2_12_FULL_38_15]